jgi:mRNA interferase RelE/StbE
MAIMRFEIVFSPEALEDYRRFDAREKTILKVAIETHLRFEPSKESKSRIKRLRKFLQPQYRLRVDEHRIFYDILEDQVEILGIVFKPDAEIWLAQFGKLPINEETATEE